MQKKKTYVQEKKIEQAQKMSVHCNEAHYSGWLSSGLHANLGLIDLRNGGEIGFMDVLYVGIEYVSSRFKDILLDVTIGNGFTVGVELN